MKKEFTETIVKGSNSEFKLIFILYKSKAYRLECLRKKDLGWIMILNHADVPMITYHTFKGKKYYQVREDVRTFIRTINA